MFTKDDFKVGQNVYFGRRHGEQTLGVIEKKNPTKAKVRTLEVRGQSRERDAGVIWTVSYSLMRPADATAKPGTPAPPVPKEPLKYSPFSDDNLLLEAVMVCYNGLSPENLCMDGEASMTHIRRTSAESEPP